MSVLRARGFLALEDVVINPPRERVAGIDMRQAIPQQMQDAGKVIILDTPVSSQSPWVITTKPDWLRRLRSHRRLLRQRR